MAGLFDGTPLERPVTCGAPVADCACPTPPTEANSAPSPNQQSPRVRRERRRGKWCAVVADIEGDSATLRALLGELKTELGCGGGLSDGQLVLQGDCRDAVVAKLVERGYRAKAAGG